MTRIAQIENFCSRSYESHTQDGGNWWIMGSISSFVDFKKNVKLHMIYPDVTAVPVVMMIIIVCSYFV